MRTHAITLAAAIALGAAPLATMHAQAGSIAQRVGAVRSGTVRLEYATRDGACGDGRSTVAIGRMFHSVSWEGWGSFGGGTRCLPGDARITLTMAEGKVTGLRSTIGGAWSADAAGTSLGRVAAADAAAYFLDLARTAEGRVGRGALWASAIADSAQVARPLLAFAVDEARLWTSRRTAMQLAGATGDASIVPELERLARTATADVGGAKARKKQEGNVGFIAAEALAMVPDGAGIEALLRLAGDSPSTEVRKTAVFHAAQSGDPRGVRLARTIAEDGRAEEELRNVAIFALLNREDAAAEERAWARRIFPTLTSDKLRDPILMGLAQHGAESDRRWVLALATDDKLPVKTRRSAVFWAGQGGTPVPELLATYRTLGDAQVKEHVIFALSQRDGDAATDALVDIARKDSDREMRRKAIFWLGQRKDERATRFLTDLINN